MSPSSVTALPAKPPSSPLPSTSPLRSPPSPLLSLRRPPPRLSLRRRRCPPPWLSLRHQCLPPLCQPHSLPSPPLQRRRRISPPATPLHLLAHGSAAPPLRRLYPTNDAAVVVVAMVAVAIAVVAVTSPRPLPPVHRRRFMTRLRRPVSPNEKCFNSPACELVTLLSNEDVPSNLGLDHHGIYTSDTMSGLRAKFIDNETPLGDITNLSVTDLRKQRAREKHASLTKEQKEVKLMRSREYNHKRKEASTTLNQSTTSNELIQPVITPRRLTFSEQANEGVSLAPSATNVATPTTQVETVIASIVMFQIMKLV